MLEELPVYNAMLFSTSFLNACQSFKKGHFSSFY